MIIQVDSTIRRKEDGTIICAVSTLIPQAYQKCTKKITGAHSNGFVELASIFDALTMLADSTLNKDVLLETDSTIAYYWLIKGWKISDPEKEKIEKIIERCKELIARHGKVKIKMIGRKKSVSDLNKIETVDLEKLEELNV